MAKAKKQKAEKIVRHSPLVRWTHWAVALSGLTLLFSGFGEMPMYKRYKIIELPGLGWAGDYEIQLVIHYIAAVVFSAAVLFHLVYHRRQRQNAAMMKRGDMRESWRIMKAMVLRRPEPPQGKFLAEQRVAYAAIGVVSLILIGTGLLKSLKNFNSVTFGETTLTVITLIHTFAAMAFMLLFFAHMFAFVIKPNWPLFTTMFTGKVKKSYVEHRHSEWDWRAEQPAGAVVDLPSAETGSDEEQERPKAA